MCERVDKVGAPVEVDWVPLTPLTGTTGDVWGTVLESHRWCEQSLCRGTDCGMTLDSRNVMAKEET